MMATYVDIFSGDELFSNCKLSVSLQVLYEVEASHILGENVGSNIANIEVDSIKKHHLKEVSFDMKSYTDHLKAYTRRVQRHLSETFPSQEELFCKNIHAAVKKILQAFHNIRFFKGLSDHPEGMVLLLDYREDGITPYLMAFKHGVYERRPDWNESKA